MKPVQYEALIKALLSAWFREFGVAAKIPDLSRRADFDEWDRRHILKLYYETRADYEGKVVVPDHVYRSVMGDAAADACIKASTESAHTHPATGMAKYLR